MTDEIKEIRYIRHKPTGDVGMVRHHASGAVEYPEFMFEVAAQAIDFEYVEIQPLGTAATHLQQVRDLQTQKGIEQNHIIALLGAVKNLKGLLELTVQRVDCPSHIKLSIAQSPRITEANAALRLVAGVAA
jgi:hypothetical protein